jgi:hypothetical protein
MSDPFEDLSGAEQSLWISSFASNENLYYDATAQALFHEAYFNPGGWDKDELSAIRDNLHDYLMDEYGIDFDEVFDWEAWREAYG